MKYIHSKDHLPRLCLLIIGGAVLLRIITFLISTNYGADSISRSLIAYNWSQEPFFIWQPNAETSVWLPLPFYINGMALMIWDTIAMTPRVISFVVSIASLVIFYLLARRLFSNAISMVALACFATFTIHIKHGNIASSEALFIFLVLASIYFYERLLKRPQWFVVAGLSLSLLGAVMTRFETWLLPPFMLAATIVSRRDPDDPPGFVTVRSLILASILPGLFMLSWMYGSYREFGDALYSLHEASVEHAGLTAAFTESSGRLRVLLYNAAFWPGILLISLSPLLCMAGLWGMIRSIIDRIGITWVVFTALILGIYYYKSIVTGELAPLARYTILPGTFLCLFAGSGLSDLAKKIRPTRPMPVTYAVLIAGLIWAGLLSGNYIDSNDARLRKLASVSPVTHYPASLSPVISWLSANTRANDKVIFSTPSFASNSIIMYSGIRPEQVIPVNERDTAAITDKITRGKPDYLIIHDESPFLQLIGTRAMNGTVRVSNSELFREAIIGDYEIYRIHAL